MLEFLEFDEESSLDKFQNSKKKNTKNRINLNKMRSNLQIDFFDLGNELEDNEVMNDSANDLLSQINNSRKMSKDKFARKKLGDQLNSPKIVSSETSSSNSGSDTLTDQTTMTVVPLKFKKKRSSSKAPSNLSPETSKAEMPATARSRRKESSSAEESKPRRVSAEDKKELKELKEAKEAKMKEGRASPPPRLKIPLNQVTSPPSPPPPADVSPSSPFGKRIKGIILVEKGSEPKARSASNASDTLPIDIAQAKYSFKMETKLLSNKYLEFNKGDIITVLAKRPNGWWKGTCAARTGYFPETYVRSLTESNTNYSPGSPQQADVPPYSPGNSPKTDPNFKRIVRGGGKRQKHSSMELEHVTRNPLWGDKLLEEKLIRTKEEKLDLQEKLKEKHKQEQQRWQQSLDSFDTILDEGRREKRENTIKSASLPLQQLVVQTKHFSKKDDFEKPRVFINPLFKNNSQKDLRKGDEVVKKLATSLVVPSLELREKRPLEDSGYFSPRILKTNEARNTPNSPTPTPHLPEEDIKSIDYLLDSMALSPRTSVRNLFSKTKNLIIFFS